MSKQTKRPAGKGGRERAPSETATGRMLLLLEQIQEQNRATIEAVYAESRRLDRKIDERFDQLAARIDVLEIVVRKNSEDIRKNSEDIAALQREVSRLSTLVEGKPDAIAFAALEKRVEALERRLGL